MSLHHGLRSAAGASVADPYFANTSLLLLGNGTNGGQNNTFTDGSSNAFSVTRYGNTTQGSFSPFGYNWSNYFDGNGDYLNVPVSSALRFGTGDFTVEAWIFLTGDAAQDGGGNRTASICSCYPASTLTSAWAFIIFGDSSTTGTGLILGTANGGAASGDCTVTYSFSKNTWYHVAASRSSGTTRVYINGVSQSYTGTIGSTLDPAVIDPFLIGSSNNSAYRWYFPGYISNFRFVKGTAVYSGSSFTVPTAPLTAITNTSLLTCQSNRFLDNSSNAFAITPYGDAKVTNFAPFPTNSEYSTGVNGGSGYFDGSSDYLSVASNSAFAFGTGDFTVECWIYWKSLSNNIDNFASVHTAGPNGGFSFYYDGGFYSANKLAFSDNYSNQIYESFIPKTGQWYHFVVSRVSSNLRLWVNGIQLGNTQTATTNYAQGPLEIGGDSTTANSSIDGYISSLRIVKGSGVTSVTVPTAPLNAITNTSLLLNFTNGSIIDSTGKNDLETVGDAQISTATKKFGTGSLKFDGTGDLLNIPSSTTIDLGSGDFTIEMWVHTGSVSSQQGLITKRRPDATASGTWGLRINSGGSFYFEDITSSTGVVTFGTLSTNTWTHVAVTRSGSTVRGFIDGSLISSGTNSTNFTNTYQMQIGAWGTVGAGGPIDSPFNGNIDDLRVSKVCRYTSNFTPPTRQLPAR